MKKIFTLSALGMMLASSLQAQDWTWAEDIARLNPEVVDSVIPIINPKEDFKWYQSCMIYYHQPLQHDNPSLGNVSLRAVFTIYNFEQFKDRMVQMHIDGYQLNDLVIEEPNHSLDIAGYCAEGEINYNYEGHLLRPEHRFFGTSVPEKPWENIEYCNAKEAAADFHALAEAVKKVFKGKWVISGVSKGGMCAAIQHAYYPDDADCFVPYVAPILTSTNDLCVQERCMSEILTPEMREHIRHIVTETINRPAIYTYYENHHSSITDDAECRCTLLTDVYDMLGKILMETSRSAISNIFESNQSYLKENGLNDYSDEMLAYFLEKKSIFDLGASQFDIWKKISWDKLFHPQTSTPDDDDDSFFDDIDYSDFDEDPSDEEIEYERVWNIKESGFHYQAVRELGYYGLKWDYFYDTQAKIDSVNQMWQSTVSNVVAFKNGSPFNETEYNPELMNLVRQQTASATKPLLYLYGGDDFWTGGRIQDEYINNQNVRLYILPEQNHSACISKITDTEMQDEIWAFLDKIFRNTPNAIEQIELPASAKARYNLFGQPADEAQGFVVRDGQVMFVK